MVKWLSKDLKDLNDRYMKMLMLDSYPVAVKMVSDEAEFEKVVQDVSVRLIEGKNLAVCQVLRQPSYCGCPVAVKKNNLSFCIAGAAAFGFQELPHDYPDTLVGYHFINEEIARRTFANVPKFWLGQYFGMLLAPLDQMPVDPDVVLFFGNTAQMYRFIQGYNVDKGERLKFAVIPVVGCAQMVVAPIKIGKINITFGTTGFRLLGWPSDTGSCCSVPANLLEDILKGMEYNHRGFVRYPLFWQIFDIELPPGNLVRNVIYDYKSGGFGMQQYRNKK